VACGFVKVPARAQLTPTTETARTCNHAHNQDSPHPPNARNLTSPLCRHSRHRPSL